MKLTPTEGVSMDAHTPEREPATVENLSERAYALGVEHGTTAAGWYFDGNTSDATYAQVLQGIEDVDPEIIDTFPHSPLSGEWADGMTPRALAYDLDVDPDGDLLDDLCSSYEDGFGVAVATEIERAARQALGREDDLDETSPQLATELRRALCRLFGKSSILVEPTNTGGGCMVLIADLTIDGRGLGRQVWLTREDGWHVGFYDPSIEPDDDGIVVSLVLNDALSNSPAAVAAEVAGILRRLGVTTLQGA